MKSIKELEEENKMLKMELTDMKKRGVTNKEHYLKELAKVFGEEAMETHEYKNHDGERKSYQSLKQFYDAVGRVGKDNLIDLIEKIKKYQKENKGVTKNANNVGNKSKQHWHSHP